MYFAARTAVGSTEIAAFCIQRAVRRMHANGVFKNNAEQLALWKG